MKNIKDSLQVAKMLSITHYSVTKILNKYLLYFNIFGEIETKNIKDGIGRPTNLKLLNEKHINLLIILLKNNDNNVKLKIDLLKKIYK